MLPLRGLDRIREERGLTQEQLAVAAGLTSSTLRHYSHGQPGATIDRNVAKLAEILGVEPLDLYGLQLDGRNGDSPDA